jgi:hypothetical protein
MKILITGSREIKDIDFVFNILYKEIKKEDTLIHGGALGVDLSAEAWCQKNNIKSLIIKPILQDKKEYYLYRNAEMVGMCDKVIAIWDGMSRGTAFTIKYAQARKKPVTIFIYKK